MILLRRRGGAGLALGFAAALLSSTVVQAQTGSGKESPTGGAPEGAPRSRLTLSGGFEVDSYSQKNFLLGAAADSAGRGEYDAFWTQRLTLRPRLILSDDLNITMKVDLARGVWGLDHDADVLASGSDGTRRDLLALRVDRAYLSFRHRPSATRWYLGRQQFALGNMLVLDEDAPGLQIWRDFGRRLSLGVSAVKETEAGGIADHSVIDSLATPRRIADNRDADLLLVELRHGEEDRGLFVNPFLAYYLDRSNADGATLLPDGHELQARFRPNVTRATVYGVALARAGGALRVDAEVDWLKGVDRVRVPGAAGRNSGPNEAHDVNNGDLKGMNVYGRIVLAGEHLELSGTGARGSGDENPFDPAGEGNINSLASQGHWFLTEVWENGLSLEDVGIAPQGLGNPRSRGYRGLENTTALQVAGAFKLRHNFKLGGSWTLLRTTQPVKPWFDEDGDGVISTSNAHQLNEYGIDRFSAPPLYRGGETTELGSEIDFRLDWTLRDRMTVTLRGGIFSPGAAAGYVINGTQHYLESVRGLRLNVTAPIPEFSLGG